MIEDIELYFLFALLLYTGFFIKNKILKKLIMFSNILLFMYYIGDIVTLYVLNSRLLFNDLVKYSRGMENIVFDAAKDFFARTEGLCLLFCLAFFLLINLCKIRSNKYIFISLMTCLIISVNYTHRDHALNVLTHNFIRINAKQTRYTEYSDRFIKSYTGNHLFTPITIDGKNKNINVIVVSYESLSSYQSNLFSGLLNYTKNFDTLSIKNQFAKNFFNNTYNSSSGNFCLLSGHFAIPNPKEEFPWENKTMLRECIVHDLKQKNYETIFITPQSRESGKLGRIAELAGFRKSIFLDDPLFEKYNNKRDDLTLYKALLDVTSNTKSNYFAYIVTTTTHPPYVDPMSGKYDIEKAYKFADDAFLYFYKKLQEKNFLITESSL